MTRRIIRRYHLTYDDHPPEMVRAYTPSEAVTQRVTRAMPATVTDLTAHGQWRRRPRRHATPLLDAAYGPGWTVVDDDGWDPR